MMLHRIVAWLMFLFMIGTTSMNGLIYTHYELNKANIIELFCINKDKPRLKCDGKCHLKTTLQKASEQEEGIETSNMVYTPLSLFVDDSRSEVLNALLVDFNQWQVVKSIGKVVPGYYYLLKPPI